MSKDFRTEAKKFFNKFKFTNVELELIFEAEENLFTKASTKSEAVQDFLKEVYWTEDTLHTNGCVNAKKLMNYFPKTSNSIRSKIYDISDDDGMYLLTIAHIYNECVLYGAENPEVTDLIGEIRFENNLIALEHRNKMRITETYILPQDYEETTLKHQLYPEEPYQLSGNLIAEVLHNTDYELEEECELNTLQIFMVNENTYICVKDEMIDYKSKSKQSVICTNEREVIEFFGDSDFAKQLYLCAHIDFHKVLDKCYC